MTREIIQKRSKMIWKLSTSFIFFISFSSDNYFDLPSFDLKINKTQDKTSFFKSKMRLDWWLPAQWGQQNVLFLAKAKSKINSSDITYVMASPVNGDHLYVPTDLWIHVSMLHSSIIPQNCLFTAKSRVQRDVEIPGCVVEIKRS